MTSYELTLNVNPQLVDTLMAAGYSLCLGVYSEANGKPFSSPAVQTVPISEIKNDKLTTTWEGAGYYKYFMKALTLGQFSDDGSPEPLQDDEGKDPNEDYPLLEVNFKDVYEAPATERAKVAPQAEPSLTNGFGFRNEIVACSVLYRRLATESTEVAPQLLFSTQLWIPGTGHLKLWENQAWVWLATTNSEGGVETEDESDRVHVTFMDKTPTVVNIGIDGKLRQERGHKSKMPIRLPRATNPILASKVNGNGNSNVNGHA